LPPDRIERRSDRNALATCSNRLLLFGNSGSGKSTLAGYLASAGRRAHLDLDTLAWRPTSPPERQSLEVSARRINEFMNHNDRWVIEGCYADLIELAVTESTEMIFLDLPVNDCIANARNRPWEPHKYQSKADQDANLGMLIDWISQYESRQDEFSATAHRRLYNTYTGPKRKLTSNPLLDSPEHG